MLLVLLVFVWCDCLLKIFRVGLIVVYSVFCIGSWYVIIVVIVLVYKSMVWMVEYLNVFIFGYFIVIFIMMD